ncbi:MAG: Ig-like domain repeat protein [Terracidiphilus sp.]
MTASLRSLRSAFAAISFKLGPLKAACAALLFALPLLSLPASAQAPATTISGTVYDPRTTASSLPLPNVLVYVTSGTVDPLPSGVQCLTSSNSTPTGVVSYTYTAVDGTFTLGNVPLNATYTLVIQAGKWRRQFSETVAAVPLTGLSLHMPSTHAQGDIPLIAIATGALDALECVLLDMGIAPTEFTDDIGSVNPGGRIHLYSGSYAEGAEINASTPYQTALMSNSATMNSYDVLMFPCQGNAIDQATATGATNLLNYANSGGRVFATHYSYAWLDPDSPYDSQFPPVANWTVTTEEQVAFGVGSLDTGFTDGATMAQWLQNANATVTGTNNQIDISALRTDVSSVISPTQSWVTLDSSSYHGQTGNPVMQMTFNTPVGSPAASQCGRVMYNDYHVYNGSAIGAMYNPDLPGGQTFTECSQQPHTMTPQEEMLEYALFDLSSFVTPVVVPTLSIAFNPSPLIVKQSDSADELAINATNTSSTAEIYSSVVLTLTLPYGLTATSLSDSTGGWICALGTLTCTRTTSIAAGASDPVTLTVSVPASTTGRSTQGTITAIASSPNFSSSVTAADTVIFQQPPAIVWATPAPILYGTPLGATQLNATSPIKGSFSYSFSAGTVLSIGQHTLTANFSPTDTTDYTTSTATVTLTIIPSTPLLMLGSSVNPIYTSNPVTFTATLTTPAAAPTGAVSFYDGTTLLGTGVVTASVVTYTMPAPATGIHSITALYSGDSNYSAATSPVLSEIIQDFTLTLLGGNGTADTMTVPLGGHVTYPFVITPVGGAILPAAVSMSLAGLPPGMTAIFSAPVVTANSPAANVALLVLMPGNTALQPPPGPFGGRSLPVALGLILLPLAGRLRKDAHRFRTIAVLALAGAALAVELTGCHITFTPQSIPLTITATSGTLSHSATVNIIVQ